VTRMEKTGHRTLPLGCRDILDTPLTEEELQAAVNKGACNKVPGREDICLSFFKVNWDNFKYDMLSLFKQMYSDGRFMQLQKHVIVVCISKADIPTHQRTTD